MEISRNPSMDRLSTTADNTNAKLRISSQLTAMLMPTITQILILKRGSATSTAADSQELDRLTSSLYIKLASEARESPILPTS